MEAVAFAARKARVRYRHGLRTLAYVTLDQANGGVVRNLSDQGVAIHAVVPPQPQQTVRLRFELRQPNVRVDVHGEVAWVTSSGQCGVRFVDLSPRARRQINRWIFGSLLDFMPQDAGGTGSILTLSPVSDGLKESDGLIVSALPRPVIQLGSKVDRTFERKLEPVQMPTAERPVIFDPESSRDASEQPQDWFSQPLSGRTVALLVDSLVVIAGLLLFSLVFLATARELPRWSVTIGSLVLAGAFVSTAYWTLLSLFGESSLGERVARLATRDLNDPTEGTGPRFR
jgi:PilZ domain